MTDQSYDEEDFDGEFEEIEKELSLLQKRAETSKHLDFNQELKNNLLPLIRSMHSAYTKRFEFVEEQIAAIIDVSDSVLQPALSLQIVTALQLGLSLCQLLKTETAVDLPEHVRDAMTSYEAAAAEALVSVTEVTIPGTEDEEKPHGG